MKKLLYIILPIVFATIIYLISSYIAWDFNAGNWDSGGRLFSGISMIFAIVLGIALADELNNKPQ
jgi:hypothetical protein